MEKPGPPNNRDLLSDLKQNHKEQKLRHCKENSRQK